MTELPLAYCERLASGAEPFNVISNLGYAIVAAWWFLRPPSGDGATHARDAAMVLGIALFSTLFHARPSATTQLLDVLAIALVVGLLLHRALLHAVRMTTAGAASAVAVWALTSALLSRFPAVLSGSLLYVPTLLALALLYWQLISRRRALGVTLALFAAALASRTLDRPLCELLPHGTHVGWHLLSAAALATFLRSLEPVERRR